MKRIIFLSFVLPLFIFSCQSKIPIAKFHTDTVNPEVGHEVLFTNDSQHAEKFEWDFGDGFGSNEENPIHMYNVTGTFDVTLTVISKSDLEDKATLTLDVMVPTILEIEVREYYEEYVVPDASVYLYSDTIDWDAHEENNVSEGFTDANGIVVFANLDPIEYYVDVWEQNHNNYTLRNEEHGIDLYIRTPVMLPHQINKFTAWVDYYDTKGKREERGSRSVVIKKFERKVEDKKQPSADSGIQDWQELYNRRAGK